MPSSLQAAMLSSRHSRVSSCHSRVSSRHSREGGNPLQPYSLTLELKKSTAEKDRACRSLCALANGQGGQVVFGVTPAGKVVGEKEPLQQVPLK
jgi:hypothetical protein